MLYPPKPRQGRGAVSNPEGRFESRRVSAVDDGWLIDSDAQLPPLATTVTAERARSIISRNDSPDIPFEQSINPYRGCGHGCIYCAAGDTQILMVNGHKKALGDLSIGDEIIGTARRGVARRFVRTQVLAHWETHKTAYRVMLADGTSVTASADHRFLSDRGWAFVAGAANGAHRRPILAAGVGLVGIPQGSETREPRVQDRHVAASLSLAPVECHRDLLGSISNAAGTFQADCMPFASAKYYIEARVAAALGLGRPSDRAGQAANSPATCSAIRGASDPRSPLFQRVSAAIAHKRSILGHEVESHPALNIVEIEALGKSMPMYDITTGTGDFIANGVVSHNCYARPAHAYVNLSPGLDFETKLFYKDNAAALLEAELSNPRYVCKSINLGANTDPYQPIERKLKVTRSILKVLQKCRHPVTIVTKGHLVERDIDILSDMARDNLAAVHVSVTTLDSSLKRILEPRAPAASARLQAMKSLHGAGIPVGALVAPVIPAINDHEIEHILAAVAQAGARSAAYVMLRLPHEVKDLFREWLAAHYPLRAAHVMAIVNDLRGGRDNDPRFGSRMRGSGVFAELVRRRFDVAARRLNLNSTPREALATGLFRPPLRPGAQLDLGF